MKVRAVDYIGLPPSKPLNIEVDDREKLPYVYPSRYALCHKKHLKTFDYRLKDDHGWAVERKSIPDLISSFFTHGARELRKVERAKDEFDKGLPVVYVIEGTVTDVVKYRQWHRFKRGNSQGFISHKFNLAIKHNFVLQWCRDRDEAGLVMYRLLKNRDKQLKKEKR